MSWLKIVIQIFLSMPKIIEVIKEIMDLIKQIQSPAQQDLNKKHLGWLVGKIRQEGMTPQNANSLHAFRDNLKMEVNNV